MTKVLEDTCYCGNCRKHTVHYRIIVEDCKDEFDVEVCSECSTAFSLLVELIDFLESESCKCKGK